VPENEAWALGVWKLRILPAKGALSSYLMLTRFDSGLSEF